MSKDLLDNEFYEKKEMSARDWWEKKRNLFNKFCLVSVALLFLITVISYFHTENSFAGSILGCIIFSLVFFSFSNLAFSGVWIFEDLLNKVFSLKVNVHTRNIFFRIILFLLFLPVLLYLIIFQF